MDCVSRPIIFADESTVSQDMNKVGTWRCCGECVPEDTSKVGQHPISVMVCGAIGPGVSSTLVRRPLSVNGDSYIQRLAGSFGLGV
jgi:hypothetical protein